MAVSYMHIRFTVSLDFDGNDVFLHFSFISGLVTYNIAFRARGHELIPDTEMHSMLAVGIRFHCSYYMRSILNIYFAKRCLYVFDQISLHLVKLHFNSKFYFCKKELK